MKMIVGLGNPGREYEKTRHNVGFMVIDNYIKNESLKQKFNSEYIKKDDAIFIKPLTYMNLSGKAVKQFQQFYKIELKDIMIIHDDLDLSLGSGKIKFSSSSGGNNGVKSIIEELNSKDFVQYKIGISQNKLIDTKDYVLGKFSNNELELLNKQIDTSKQIIDYFLIHDYNETMNHFNGVLK